MIENVEQVLIVDIEESHLDVVIEHGPGYRPVIVDGAQGLQDFFVSAVVKGEFTCVGRQNHLGASDPILGVLAYSGQALGAERLLNQLRPIAAVACLEGPCELLSVHQCHDQVRGAAIVRHRHIEVGHAVSDIGDHPPDLRPAIGRRAIDHEDSHRFLEFPDALGALVELQLGAERDLEEAIDDLVVGERGSFTGAPDSNIGVLRLRRAACDAGGRQGRGDKDRSGVLPRRHDLFRCQPRRASRGF